MLFNFSKCYQTQILLESEQRKGTPITEIT